MIAQGLDVNHAGHITRTSAVFQLSDLLTLIVEDVGAAPEGINRCRLFGEKVIRPEIGRDDIHVVVERSRRTLDFKEVIAGTGMWIGGAVHDLGSFIARARAFSG